MTLSCDFLFMVSQFCLLKQEPFSLEDLHPQLSPTVLADGIFWQLGEKGKADGPRSCAVTETTQNLLHCWFGHFVCVCFSNACIWGRNECVKSRHSNVIWSVKMKEHASVQQQHFFIQLACNPRCMHNDQKPYLYLKINYYGGIYRKDILMHFISLSNYFSRDT